MRASGSKLGAGAAPNKYMIYVSETFWAGVPLNCSSFKPFNTWLHHTDKCDKQRERERERDRQTYRDRQTERDRQKTKREKQKDRDKMK